MNFFAVFNQANELARLCAIETADIDEQLLPGERAEEIDGAEFNRLRLVALGRDPA